MYTVTVIIFLLNYFLTSKNINTNIIKVTANILTRPIVHKNERNYCIKYYMTKIYKKKSNFYRTLKVVTNKINRIITFIKINVTEKNKLFGLLYPNTTKITRIKIYSTNM